MKKLVGVGVVVIAVVVAWLAWPRGPRAAIEAAANRGSGSIVVGHDAANAALPASIAGRVVRADGGAIAGALVALTKTELELDPGGAASAPLLATTDATGAWAIPKVPPGRYGASAQARGFLPGRTPRLVLASAEQKAGVVITLAPGGTIVSGTVSDVGGGPIAEARVAAHPEARSPFDIEEYVAVTTKDGHYELALADGDYRITANHDDYTSTSDPVELVGSPVTHDFVLVPGGVIHGVVIARETNKPVAGAIVTADSRHDSKKHALQATDPDGTFTVRGLRPGAVSLEAGGKGYASAQPTTVELGIGETIDNVRIVVDKAYSISGTVVKKGTKEGVANIGVGVFQMTTGRGQEHTGAAPSDDKGRWEIDGIRPGSFTLFAFGEEAVPNIGKGVTVVDKDVTGVELEIEAGVTLAGKVTPPQAAAITVELAGEVGIANMFDAIKTFMVRGDSDPTTGAFTLHNVPTGAFKLIAKATAGPVGQLPIVVTAADQRDLIVPLETRASISGKVIDTTGAAVAGIPVSAKRTDSDHPVMFMMGGGGNRGGATTRTDGTFKILSLEAGEYEMRANPDGDEDYDREYGKDDKTKKRQPITVKVALGDDKTGIVLTIAAENGVIRARSRTRTTSPLPIRG